MYHILLFSDKDLGNCVLSEFIVFVFLKTLMMMMMMNWVFSTAPLPPEKWRQGKTTSITERCLGEVNWLYQHTEILPPLDQTRWGTFRVTCP